MSYGVTPQGFIPKTIDVLRGEAQSRLKAAWGAFINVAVQSRIGQLIESNLSPLAELWALGETLANYFDPNQATGAQLDNLAALTGTARKAASFSSVVLTLTGTPGTVVAAGKIAGVTGTSALFATTANQTIIAAAAWLGTHLYAAGARVTNGGNIYVAIQGGTSAGAGGPTGTGSSIADNTVIWAYVGAGTGFVDSLAICTVTGPIRGDAFSVTTISTPVAGWANVNNLLDATPGTNIESDPALRLRRVAELANGKSPLDAVIAAVGKVAGVTTVVGFQNFEDFTVGDLPAHSIMILAEGGDDTAIAQAIFDTWAAGIATAGTTTVTLTDSAGNNADISFQRPQDVNVYVQVTLTFDASLYPLNGDQAVKDAIVEAGAVQALGRDVVPSAISAWVMAGLKQSGTQITDGVPGVLNVSQVLVGTTFPPLSAIPLVMSQKQRALYDTSRITVISVQGTP